MQAGQILLIIVLVMTIALTIGLSVASRTISNLRVSTDEENSQRAFSAAEAGIEQAMQTNTQNSGSFSNNTDYQTTITTVSGLEFILNNRLPVLKDNAVDLWLSAYPGYTSPWSGTLTIYWGKGNDACNTNETLNTMPALEILVITGNKANPVLTHYPVDVAPCSARAAPPTGNLFEVIPTGGGTVEGRAFSFRKTIVINSGLLVRIIPLYAPSVIGVRGCAADGVTNCTDLPSQGRLITSVGTADTTQRKLIGFEENPKIPMQFLPYILFAPQ